MFSRSIRPEYPMSNNFLATLPMYDWPEVAAATDAYWRSLRDEFRKCGFAVPENLTRGAADLMTLWKSPNLLFGQTCGLPFASRLHNAVSLIGTPAYDICCGAGSYFSVLIVRKDSDISNIATLPGKSFAYNDPLSQSGFAAACHQLKADGVDLQILGSCQRTGSHRASIRTVAEGKADFAAIDAVTWELAKRHEAAADGLRVLKTTQPTLGLPYITSQRPRRETDRLHMAVIDAMASLDEEVREALLLMGLAVAEPADYGILNTRYEAIPARYRETG